MKFKIVLMSESLYCNGMHLGISFALICFFLQVYENGSNENDQVFYFNLAGALRGTNDKDRVLTRVSTN